MFFKKENYIALISFLGMWLPYIKITRDIF